MNLILSAELIKYNANDRDNHVGDCVCRAMSLAFGMSYAEARVQLNRFKRAKRADAYNHPIIYRALWAQLGAKYYPVPAADRTTVAEFADVHTAGTYIAETGAPNRAYTDHVVCIIDGDVYDSWDSLDQIVHGYYVVSTQAAHLPQSEHDAMWVFEQINPALDEYCEYLANKFEYVENLFIDDRTIKNPDPYTVNFKVLGRIDKEALPVRQNSKYQTRSESSAESEWAFNLGRGWDMPVSGYPSFSKWFTVKVTPRGVTQDTVIQVQKSIKQKIYDWFYLIKKEIADTVEADKIGCHPRYWGNRLNLMKCPEWARPMITDFSESSYAYDRFVVTMDTLPDDPRADDCPYVEFRADTLSELKGEFEAYKRNYARFGYDY